MQKQSSTVVITGASSGVGLHAANALSRSGNWHVVMACRDLEKAHRMARSLEMSPESYTALRLDLADLASVRTFANDFLSSGRPLDALVCNAAVYTPTAREVRRTVDGYELSVGTNHLGHFLLIQLLLDKLRQSPGGKARLVILGTITHNPRELGGSIPPRPDLGDLQGLAAGFKAPHSMIDGGAYNPVKAYKDSKVCNILTMRELHRRHHESTGITFSSLYPGCVATSGLFRESPALFRTIFPFFQKYITGGFVSEEESGRRVAEVVSSPAYNRSGLLELGQPSEKDGRSYLEEVSSEASDDDKARRLWELSARLVGL